VHAICFEYSFSTAFSELIRGLPFGFHLCSIALYFLSYSLSLFRCRSKIAPRRNYATSILCWTVSRNLLHDDSDVMHDLATRCNWQPANLDTSIITSPWKWIEIPNIGIVKTFDVVYNTYICSCGVRSNLAPTMCGLIASPENKYQSNYLASTSWFIHALYFDFPIWLVTVQYTLLVFQFNKSLLLVILVI